MKTLGKALIVAACGLVCLACSPGLYSTSPVPVTGVSLSPDVLSLALGGGAGTLSATVAPSNAEDPSLRWASSDTEVATVSGGVVTPVALGSSTITVTTIDGGKTATAMVTVSPAPIPITGIGLKGSTSIIIGNTEQLVPVVSPPDATDPGVSWTTSDATIASVSAAGLVGGVKIGTATITASSESDREKTATCLVTVTDVPIAVTGLNIGPLSVTLSLKAPGTAITCQLSPSVQPTNATNQKVTWASGSPAVATVSASGLVSAVAPGATSITATSVDGGYSASSSITVIQLVTGISISPTTATIAVGGGQALAATVSPANAADKSLTWSSAATSVVSCSGTGLVTGLAVGAATITAAATDGSGISKTCVVRVTPPAPALSLSMPSYFALTLGWASVPGANTYQVYRATSLSGPWTNQIYNGAATSYVDSSLASATTYYYCAKATSALYGASPLSSPISGTTALAPPMFNIGGGNYWGSQSVTISGPPGATVYYTTDGSSPSSSHGSTSQPVLVASSQTVKAISCKTGVPDSAVVGNAYSIKHEFVYSVNFQIGSLACYEISSLGTLTEIGGSPFAVGPTGSYPSRIVIDPSRRFLYVMAGLGSGIYAFTINQGTGALTPVSGSPYTYVTSPQVNITAAVIPASGKFLYVAYSNSKSLRAFTIDQTTGALSPMAGSPFVMAAYQNALVADPTGNFLYVAEQTASQNLAAYRIDQTTGALAQTIPNSRFGVGTPFYTPSQPTSMAFSNLYLYVTNANNISAFQINGSTGELYDVPGSNFAAGTSPQRISVNPTAGYVYVLNYSTNNLREFTIGAVGGLTETSGSPITTGTGPRSVCADPSGKFLYVANEGSSGIGCYTLGAGGSISPNPYMPSGFPAYMPYFMTTVSVP